MFSTLLAHLKKWKMRMQWYNIWHFSGFATLFSSDYCGVGFYPSLNRFKRVAQTTWIDMLIALDAFLRSYTSLIESIDVAVYQRFLCCIMLKQQGKAPSMALYNIRKQGVVPRRAWVLTSRIMRSLTLDIRDNPGLTYSNKSFSNWIAHAVFTITSSLTASKARVHVFRGKSGIQILIHVWSCNWIFEYLDVHFLFGITVWFPSWSLTI